MILIIQLSGIILFVVWSFRRFTALSAAISVVMSLTTGFALAETEAVLPEFLSRIEASALFAGADSYGPLNEDTPVVPLLKGGETVGWAFVTTDFVGTTGYSGKPINTLLAVD